MPETYDAKPNVRSAKYIIVQTRTLCQQCHLVTTVFAFSLPAGYESLCAYDDDETETWEALGIAAVLSYVEYLSEAVARHIHAITTHYRMDRNLETGESFWMNHCQHCGTQMNEEELHELDGPFNPTTDQGLEAIQLHPIHEPFEARAAKESHNLVHLDS